MILILATNILIHADHIAGEGGFRFRDLRVEAAGKSDDLITALLLGQRFGRLLGSRAEVFGGVILLLIAAKAVL